MNDIKLVNCEETTSWRRRIEFVRDSKLHQGYLIWNEWDGYEYMPLDGQHLQLTYDDMFKLDEATMFGVTND